MAEKVIGVDVGTNALRAAEVALGAHPRLLRFGQVAVPPGAVVEGEVVDEPAVAEALRRLWKEVGFRGRSVRVGIASARVILRIVEMPELSEDDTRSALGLQLGEYVPMAPESTVFGFQPIAGPDGWAAGPPGAGEGAGDRPDADDGSGMPEGPGEEGPAGTGRQQRLLLAAAHQEAVSPLVEAVQQSGLKVAAVDVIPAALARALAPAATDGVGPPPVEAIVSLGAGTTLVVVARGGTPLFSRTVTSVSGYQFTERLADQLSVARTEAERAKRRVAAVGRASQRGGGGRADQVTSNGAAAPAVPTSAHAPATALAASEPPTTPIGAGQEADATAEALMVATREAVRPLAAELVAEVADSLDYYSSQPGALPVDRVVLTGGGMRLAGTGALLSERLGLAVVDADPYARVGGVPAGFEPVDLPFLAPYLPAAVGIALGGGRSRASRIDLLPDQRRRPGGRSRLPLVAAAAAVLVFLVAGALYWQRRGDIARQEQATAAARQELNQLQAAAATPAATGPVATVDAAAVVRAALVTDPDWLAAARRLDEIHADLGIEVGNVQGAMTAPAAAQGPQTAGSTTTTTASPSTTAAGSTGTAGSASAGGTAVDPTTGAVLGVSLGSITITATAFDLGAVAAWLEAVEADPRFADARVSAITPLGGPGGGGRVQFSAEVGLTGENLVPRTLREPRR